MAAHVASLTRTENSTNVRTKRNNGKWLVRALERLSPALLAHALEPMMFRTQRRSAPDWERDVLSRGEKTRIGDLVVWSFGQGPAVLLVHGWNGRGGQLGAFVEPLTQRGFRVVTFDAPGHGQTPGSQSSLVDFGKATNSVLETIRPMFGPVHAIVAHSMGGAAVTYAIHDYVDDPRGLPVKRLAFIAPPVDVRDFIRTFVHFIGGGPDLERALRARIEDRFGLQMEELYAPALARDLDAPLLVVHDENDREVPVDRGRLLASAWPGAKLEVTSGFGHTRILREQSVIDRIVDFVSES